jgi:probable F420-dependent oxidoreductase
MRFSLELPTTRVDRPDEFVSGESVAEVTRAAAAAGFSAVFVTDHPAPDTRWLDHGGHHALDPFVALSFAAAADPVIRVQTNIYVAAYRNPFLGAKLVQSLDVLSGGRVILGVAAGYLKPEFAALGVDFDRRGELLDDALALLDAALDGSDVTRDGPGYHARGVRILPVAPAGRRPPVWVGGNSTAAMRRAARHDGWAPFHTGGLARASRTAAIEAVPDLRRAIATVRTWAAEQGGRPDAAGGADDGLRPFDVCWSEGLTSDTDLSVDLRCAHLAALEDAGITWVGVGIPGATRAEVLERIAQYGRDIIDGHGGTRPPGSG